MNFNDNNENTGSSSESDINIPPPNAVPVEVSTSFDHTIISELSVPKSLPIKPELVKTEDKNESLTMARHPKPPVKLPANQKRRNILQNKDKDQLASIDDQYRQLTRESTEFAVQTSEVRPSLSGGTDNRLSSKEQLFKQFSSAAVDNIETELSSTSFISEPPVPPAKLFLYNTSDMIVTESHSTLINDRKNGKTSSLDGVEELPLQEQSTKPLVSTINTTTVDQRREIASLDKEELPQRTPQTNAYPNIDDQNFYQSIEFDDNSNSKVTYSVKEQAKELKDKKRTRNLTHYLLNSGVSGENVQTLPATRSLNQSSLNNNATTLGAPLPPNINFLLNEDIEGNYIFNELQPDTLELKDPSEAYMMQLSNRCERKIQRIWQELFGCMRIVCIFVIYFFLEFFRFLLRLLVRNLCIGLLKICSNQFWKPFLQCLYSGGCRPICFVCANLSSACFLILRPFIQSIGTILNHFGNCLANLKLCELTIPPERKLSGK